MDQIERSNHSLSTIIIIASYLKPYSYVQIIYITEK